MRRLLICLLIISALPLSQAYSQKKSRRIIVTGIVIDTSGKPVARAAFFFDGKKIPVVSKTNGTFRIRVPASTEKIAAYDPQNGGIELIYKGETTLAFKLPGKDDGSFVPPSEVAGEEVDIGYGSINRDDLTTSVGSVKKAKISRHYTTIYQMIAGEVPGVQVSGTRIMIRGATSINSSTEPLFVVNGTPVSSIDYINPQDVKSIDILKDAAASIYGTRGSNGVILIKLK